MSLRKPVPGAPITKRGRRQIESVALITVVVLAAFGLAAWKYSDIKSAQAAGANHPEPMETVTATEAVARVHRETTTSVGTVVALRSITLRNEVSGTVRHVNLRPGQIVGAGGVLVVLDASVEEAELKALQAQAGLAQTTVARLERLRQNNATSQEEVDQARAQRDVALAQVARTRAVIEKKIIRAPFRAIVGISDVHAGQYLNEGTQLTTLQGVANAAHIDFAVSQDVASSLQRGDQIQVHGGGTGALTARIEAVDPRVDPATRNAIVRATLVNASHTSPGASVRVVLPVGAERSVVAVPVSALRKGPAGDHVFVLVTDKNGKLRAETRLVVAGPVVGNEVLLLSGVKAGEQIATSGSFKLREGVLVAVAVAP